MTVKFNDGREITATEVVLNEISMIIVKKKVTMLMKKRIEIKVMKYLTHCIISDIIIKKGLTMVSHLFIFSFLFSMESLL